MKTLTKNASDLDHLAYTNYQNVLNRVKMNAMKLYFSNKCTEFKQNGKNLWSIIQKVIQKQNNKGSAIECFEINNILCFESQLIAEEFRNFFSSVGMNYANKIGTLKNP